jgi:putative transposase
VAQGGRQVRGDLAQLLPFYDFPAEHWQHLKTSNPIESTFATVRLRTRVTKGPGSGAAGLAMAFKLIQAAQERWRAVNGPHLVALVRAGAVFHDQLCRLGYQDRIGASTVWTILQRAGVAPAPVRSALT